MKKYYLDEEALKSFEKQDSCVNMHDFLTVKIVVGGCIFYPWEGKLLSWTRFLDPSRGVYTPPRRSGKTKGEERRGSNSSDSPPSKLSISIVSA